ncbi:MAG: tetratricopeptide repeat protein [Saprospiraceae bacterium]|nr:tetratricopeptide repeat protein [Saprospiraceae bacterium]
MTSSLKRISIFLLGFCLVVGSITAQDAKSAASLYNEGLALLKAKDYEAGLPILESALEKATEEENEKVVGLSKKNGSKAAYNLGNSKKKAGAFDEAIALYNKGIEWAPDYASNYSGLAAATEAKGDKIASIGMYVMAGDKTTASGKADRAEKLYKKARNMVGKMYQADDFEGAIAAGKAFLELRDNAEVNYYVCRAITESNATEEAITHIDKAIELSGETVDDKYYVAKAKAYEKMSKKQDAINAYKLVTGEKYKPQAEYKIKELGGK